ncbi:GDP-mannose 4,6-dehydratase [Candidatus Pelagibacter sp.]|jgi:dTDP-glucose 4,6-dehydratase|nr:GDP-mannose 4,6-dehydratase [Candidatus Pelagibacter sp.]
MKKILVTGGSGFIGTNFINFLLNKNFRVFNIDKISAVSTPEKFKVDHKNKNYKFYKLDLLNEKKLEKLIYLIKPNYIFNFAAESHVDRSIDNPKLFIQDNIISSLNLFNTFRRFSKKNKRSTLFHISTDEVFGSNFGKPSKESSPYFPSSPYSSSKASTDLIAISFIETYKTPIKILNLCNNFGPYQYLEKFIPTIIFNLINDKKVPVYGNGKNLREWIYINDSCRAIFSLIKYKGKIKRFNIGTNFRINNLNLTDKIFKILKHKKLTKLDDKRYFELVKDRPGHDLRYALNSKIFYDNTKFRLNDSLNSGLIKTIDWYLENKNWTKYMKKKYINKRIGIND